MSERARGRGWSRAGVAAMLWGALCAVAMAQTRTQYAYPTGDRATSVILLERVGPAEVRVNENYAYTLILTNLTGTEIKDIVLTEEIGAGFAVSAIEPQPIDQSGNTATWRWEALAPRATAQIRINGATGATGEVTGCATITFRTGVCSSTRIVQPALALVKQTPPAVLQCDPIPVRLTVTNTGNGIATNVKVRDTLPGGWTTTDGRTDLVFDAGNLSAGQSRDFNVTVNASRTGSFTNNVTASEDGGLSAQASSTTMVRKPELAVTKSCPDYRFLGRPAEFDISVTNTGDGPARDTVLSDPLPAGTQFVSATDGGQMSGGRVSWSLGTLAPGDSRTVSVAVTLTTIGQIRNVAEARAYCAQAQGECTIEVRGIPAILLEVVDINDPVEVGGNETYVITVTNQGSAPGTNIVIECTLGDQQSLVSAGGVTNAQTSGQMVRFAPLPSLAPSAKAEFRVVVTANSAGDIRFKTSMTSDQTETPVAETESTHQYE